MGVTINSQIFHWHCLECVKCKKSLGTDCVLKNGQPHCSGCEPNFFPNCVGCDQKILTHDFQWLNDRLWHEGCFACCKCKQSHELNFHTETSSLYCKEHYPGLFKDYNQTPPASPQPNLIKGFEFYYPFFFFL